MAEIINGKEIAALICQEAKDRAVRFANLYGHSPGLAVILVGNNPASEIYVRRKIEACKQFSIVSFFYNFDTNVTIEELQQTIEKLNKDAHVNGILLQLPLPEHLNFKEILSLIAPHKDVDGLHPYNQGLLAQNCPLFIPCTPQGCLQLLQSCCNDITGANIVIIGRSILVGRPLASLLTNMNATVTLAHSYTKNLQSLCQKADILITAIGKPRFLTAEYVKEGAIILDIGINYLQLDNGEKKLVGDVDFENVTQKASYITPVPGGVGPMTIANLLLNTVKAAELLYI